MNNGLRYNLMAIFQLNSNTPLSTMVKLAKKKHLKLNNLNLPDSQIYLQTKMIAGKSTNIMPTNNPSRNVVHGLCCLRKNKICLKRKCRENKNTFSSNGGTRRRFMARCRSPPSKCCVNKLSTSLIRASTFLVRLNGADSTNIRNHSEPRSVLNTFQNYNLGEFEGKMKKRQDKPCRVF